MARRVSAPRTLFFLTGLFVVPLAAVSAFRVYYARAGEAPVLPAAIMQPATAETLPRSVTRPSRTADRSQPAARYAPPGDVSTKGFIWPLAGRHQVTSPFGPRDKTFHHGSDLGCGLGQPIYAAREGRVRYAAAARTYGNVVLIDHGSSFQTLYSHLDRIDVAAGSYVGTGQMLGVCGATGNATGPHLHFEVRHDGYVYDPLVFLP